MKPIGITPGVSILQATFAVHSGAHRCTCGSCPVLFKSGSLLCVCAGSTYLARQQEAAHPRNVHNLQNCCHYCGLC